MVNLVGNAVKFTDEGSVTIQVSAARVEGSRVVLRCEVADTGVGIASIDQARLFQDFVQVDASATRRFGGTGLGLSICRKLVDLMGGRLWVESVVGAGSTFHFEIPVAVADATHTSSRAAPRSSVKGLKSSASGVPVLVVDDNEVNAEVVRGYLEPLGFDVERANDGRDAVALVAARRFAVVLMDMQMPEMNGLEATRAIRALGTSAARTPIVMLTANAMAVDRDRSLAAGADDYLSKPIDKNDLLESVGRWVLVSADAGPPPRPDSMRVVELDSSRLRDVLGALGRDKTLHLVAGAKVSLGKHLDELEAAAKTSDLSRVRHVAHEVCGAVGTLGLVHASRLAGEIERASRRDGRDIEPMALRLRELIECGWINVDRALAASRSLPPPSRVG